MVERNFTDDEETGFSRYGQDRHSKGILLPTPIAKAIEAEAAEFLAAAAREAAAEKSALQAAAAKAAVSKGATAKGLPLPSIRIHTPTTWLMPCRLPEGFWPTSRPQASCLRSCLKTCWWRFCW